MKKICVLFVALLCIAFGVKANKTAVEVKAPAEVKAGTEVTITVNVLHNGNSKSHHTEWVYLKINGKEVQRWAYTKNELPPDGNYSVDYKFIATEDLNIEAEGNCNMHGTKGPATAEVKIN